MISPIKRPTPIGEFIQKDILAEFEISQGELAKTLKVSRKTINDLINNNGGIVFYV